jgi:hypothetical protein
VALGKHNYTQAEYLAVAQDQLRGADAGLPAAPTHPGQIGRAADEVAAEQAALAEPGERERAELKRSGDAAFKAGDYAAAVVAYGRAIAAAEGDGVYVFVASYV